MKRIALLLVFVIVFGVINKAQAEEPPPSPVDAIYDTVQAVLKVNSKYSGDSNRTVRRAKLREIVVPKFNFPEMAKRCLGVRWNMATPDEQKEFVDVFSELLLRTYLSKVESLKIGMVNIQTAKIDLPDATVKTVTELQEDQVSIDYRMTLEGQEWRVYDVIIENVSVIANYRNEFQAIIRRDQMSGLIAQLKEKLKQSKFSRA